jgi:hypothetical protein
MGLSKTTALNATPIPAPSNTPIDAPSNVKEEQ